MTSRLQYLLLFCALFQSAAAFAYGDSSNFLVEVKYGMSSVNPSDLNTTRQAFQWNNTTPGTGSFNNLSGLGFALGYRVWGRAALMLAYEQGSQALGTLNIPGAGSVAESFEYDRAFVLVDMPFDLTDSLSFSLRGGLGYATQFDLKQKQSGGAGETLDWGAHPIPIRAGFTLNYALFSMMGIYADVHYESVKSSLSATSNYQSTINGKPITSGQSFGNPTNADFSGIYYGAGLRLQF